MNNPMQIIEMLKGIKDPKQAVMNIAKNNTNPMIKNLIDMAEKGDNQGVENFARNLYKQQGRNFDEEFSEFMNNFK
jgi:hypothetical protein